MPTAYLLIFALRLKSRLLKVEGQQYFLALTLGLGHFILSPLDMSPENKYLFSRRLYKLQAKITGQAVSLCITVLFRPCDSAFPFNQENFKSMTLIKESQGHDGELY